MATGQQTPEATSGWTPFNAASPYSGSYKSAPVQIPVWANKGQIPTDTLATRQRGLQSQVDSYNTDLTGYHNFLREKEASMPGVDAQQLFAQPDVIAAYRKVHDKYNALAGDPWIGESGISAPHFWNGQGGFSKFMRMAAPLAASFFLTPALGGALSGALGVSSALGSGLAGAGIGALTSKITGGSPLTGALSGGAGGFLSGGGLSSLGIGKAPLASLPGTSSGVNGILSYGSSGASSLPWLSGNALPWATPSFTDDPLKFLTNKVTSGASNMLSTDNLIKGALKGGLSSVLQDNNEGGYEALQNAYKTAANNLTPYTQPGAAASSRLADLYGLNGPAAAAAAAASFQQTPGYQFALNQGIKSLDASAAKRGMLLSGNQVQAVQNYGTGLADQLFQQYIQNLGGTANRGQSAQTQANQSTVDANAAYALMKRDKANSRNALYSGVLSSLFS